MTSTSTFAMAATKEAALRKALSSSTSGASSIIAKVTKQKLKVQRLQLQLQLEVLQELERLNDDAETLQQLFALLDNNDGAGVSAEKLTKGLHDFFVENDVETFRECNVEATQRAVQELFDETVVLTTLGEFQVYVQTWCAALNVTLQELAELLLVAVVFRNNDYHNHELGHNDNHNHELGREDDVVARILQQQEEQQRCVQSRKQWLSLAVLIGLIFILYLVIVTGTVRICKVSADYSFTLQDYYSPCSNGTTVTCQGRTLDARCVCEDGVTFFYLQPESGTVDF